MNGQFQNTIVCCAFIVFVWFKMSANQFVLPCDKCCCIEGYSFLDLKITQLFEFQNELRVVLPEERPSTPQQSRTAHVKPFVSPNSKSANNNARLMGDVAAARSTWRSLSTSRSSSRGGHVRSQFLLDDLFWGHFRLRQLIFSQPRYWKKLK